MKSGRRWVSALSRKLWTVAWDQWEHRNSILHERDSTKQHKPITQDTHRLISRQFAMGVQGLPSNNHFLFQETMEELLTAPLYVRKQWLASARERQKRRVASQAEKYPEEHQFMANCFSEEGLGNTQQSVFSVVSSLSTMSRSSPYVQT
jgi:hypothetical protein